MALLYDSRTAQITGQLKLILLVKLERGELVLISLQFQLQKIAIMT